MNGGRQAFLAISHIAFRQFTAALELTHVRFCTYKPESVAVCPGLARLFC
jgi:hypothetical protein